MAEQQLLPLIAGSQPPRMKRCAWCAEHKNISEFYERRRRGRVELRAECKACCIASAADFNKRRYATDPEYRAAQIERLKAVKRDNPEYKAARLKIDSAARRKRYEGDPEYRARIVAAESAKRAIRKAAAPPWLTQAHLAEIEAVYAAAVEKSERTGVLHHVDHIVPIKGKTVCGLHVPWNLQVLSASENAQKGNRYDDWKDHSSPRRPSSRRL